MHREYHRQGVFFRYSIYAINNTGQPGFIIHILSTVCGNKKVQKAFALQLAADANMRGVDAGPLINASVVEGLTSLLIGINARYKVKGAGIRITGLEG